MKKKQDVLFYKTKGILDSYEGLVVTTLNKKEEEDTIDMNDLLIELEKFCEKNKELDVVIKFSATASEE